MLSKKGGILVAKPRKPQTLEQWLKRLAEELDSDLCVLFDRTSGRTRIKPRGPSP